MAEISDFGIVRISNEDMAKEVAMVTSVWAKSAEEGDHEAVTIPWESLHLLRGFWMNTFKENNE